MDCTKKSRLIRKNSDKKSSCNSDMTTKKECRLQDQRQVELNQKIGMKGKKKVFTIKSKTEKIFQSSKTMRLKTKLIEVKYGHLEHSHDDYNCYGDNSWLEYETVGFFDNIQDAWDVVQQRIEKYHTKLNDYSFNIIEVNPKPQNIPDTIYEENTLNKYYQNIEKEKQRKIDENTLGFRCSECKIIIKMSFSIQNDKTTHGQTKHIQHGSWSHVNWTRIMKKGKIKN